MRRRSLAAWSVAASAAIALPAHAQAWPTRPVTLVAGFPAGTSVDILARWLADQLARPLNQPVIVENRPGVDGGIAATHVARSRPDGHTILYTTSSSHGASPSLYRTLPFDPLADFAPVTKLVDQPMLVLVRPDSMPRTLSALLDQARRAPRPLFYGFGNTSTRIGAEVLRHRAGVQFERVPYPGNPRSLQDLIAGRLDFVFTDFTTGVEQVRQGALRALAVTSATRNAQLPDVPSVAEQGFPGYDIVAWGGIVAPAATPADIVARLNAEITRAMSAPEAAPLFQRLGLSPAPMSPTEFGAYIRAEIARWRDYVTIAGIEPQ